MWSYVANRMEVSSVIYLYCFRGLFNDNVSSSCYMASNNGVINELEKV
jgi:hypothetical protein